MATFVETVSPMKSRSILTMICCYTTVQSLKKWKPNDFLHTFYVVLTTMLNELCTCSYTRKHSPIYFVWLEIQVNKDDQMSRKALYIRYYKMWNLCCVNSRNFRLDRLEHYYFFLERKAIWYRCTDSDIMSRDVTLTARVRRNS